MLIIGVDTGGTFTDLIALENREMRVYKVLSTPDNPAAGVLVGVKHLNGLNGARIVHGSTVATNALLERKGAKTALIANQGFTDVFVIGRQARPELYNLHCRHRPSLVPASLRVAVPGRILASGKEEEAFSEKEAEAIVGQLKEQGVESVAVSLLYSFLVPNHEISMGKLLEERGIPYSLSHQIVNEFREYERTSSTVINAYVMPTMQKYITRLAMAVGEDNLSIMQSNGGQISAETAGREGIRTILSGPAGGVVGAYAIAGQVGCARLITFDMGGTSTDVSLVDGELPLTMEAVVAGYPVKVPMLDIHTVGAGGGSLASLDAGGALQVGPESAGAVPGPICYGKGEGITVTDANLFLGRLDPDHFLGGRMKLYKDRIRPYFKETAESAGLTSLQLAEGICSVANANMERALRVISVEKGYDPADFTMIAFGGAAGLHAVFLAHLLNVPRVLIPPNPGILSAVGMLMADVIKDYSQTVMLTLPPVVAGKAPYIEEGLTDHLGMMMEKARQEMAREGYEDDRILIERFADVRYKGQSFELVVPYTQNTDLREVFHKAHQQRYGYSKSERSIEVVNLRLRARGLPPKPQLPELEGPTTALDNDALLGEKETIFDSRPYTTRLYRRNLLRYGNTVKGPAIIFEYSATSILPPGTWGEIDKIGNLIIYVDE